MKKEKIIVLHEYGANNHYKALSNSEEFELTFFEFAISKYTIKSFVRRDFNLLKKQIKNFFNLINLAITKDKKIILGLAPYDYRVYVLSYILRNHTVYYHTSWPYWDQSFFPKKLFYSNKLINFWKYFLESKVSHIFCVTNFTKNSLLKNYNLMNDNISVVYHSYEEEIFYYKKAIKYSQKSINFIFVGRITEEKGINLILALFKKEHMKNMTITFVGDGDLTSRIVDLSKEYKNIIYKGYISDKNKLAELYRESDFLLLPSIRQKNWEEVFGMVMIEAMSCGVVPIGSDQIGPKEIIENDKNGFIIQTDLFEETLNKIISISNEEKYYLLRENALDYAKDFTQKNILKKWQKLK